MFLQIRDQSSNYFQSIGVVDFVEMLCQSIQTVPVCCTVCKKGLVQAMMPCISCRTALLVITLPLLFSVTRFGIKQSVASEHSAVSLLV